MEETRGGGANGPKGSRVNVMSVMNALPGWIVLGYTSGAPTRLWGLVYMIWSLCTSLYPIF